MPSVASAFRRNAVVVLVAFASIPLCAQDPVHWSATVASKRVAAGATFQVALTAAVEEEWHVYSVTQGPGGPIPTTVEIGSGQRFKRAGVIRAPAPRRAFDPNFGIDTEIYEGSFTLTVPVALASDVAGGRGVLKIAVGYQACTNRLCLPPRTEMLEIPVRWTAVPAAPPSARSADGRLPEARSGERREGGPPADTRSPTPDTRRAPVAFGAAATDWRGFLWLAVTMGALSLLTPCVFPMVPITVSYFSSHAAGTRRAAVGSALVYGAGIVLTFTVLGTALAALAGAAGLNRLAANPWLNLAITGMFLAFALNLFGVFELRLPVSLLSWLYASSAPPLRTSRLAPRTSVAGTLLMALTFTITSLTCTAAFLGTLLVVAAQGEWQRPVAGLLAYSATFAIPFVVLAAAPQLVSQLPRSGPWLSRVKVVMGFLEIAAAMKFLANADLVWTWGVFTRSVVLLAWIAVAVALAAYFAALKTGRMGRFVSVAATLLLAIWLASGVKGRRLGELEAFLPPSTVHAAAGELPWITNDLEAALAQARASNRLVMIDFTGYTCTNCRWMEANMFPRHEIRGALEGFVRARLYTDGQGALYERQQRFQQEQFKTVALPLYAIVDADRRAVATFAGLTRDSAEFLRFLNVQR